MLVYNNQIWYVLAIWNNGNTVKLVHKEQANLSLVLTTSEVLQHATKL